MAPRSKSSISAKLLALSSVLHSESDHDLMKKIAENDMKSFQKLYERYKGPMLSYTLQLVRQKSLAEEITQDIFLRVYRSRDSYKPDAKFTTWLWTIARNLCFDHLRKKKEFLLTPDADSGETMIDRIESPLENAEEQLLESHERERFEKCLDKLSDPQRQSILLRTFSELDYEEIAKQMSTSLSSVKSLLHRGKEALLQCLKKQEAL